MRAFSGSVAVSFDIAETDLFAGISLNTEYVNKKATVGDFFGRG
jgi:hypothetical protein